MSALFEAVKARSPFQKFAIWIGSLLVIGILFWIYFFSGQLEQIENLAVKRERIENMIATAQHKIKILPKLKENTADLDAKLEKAYLQLPDSREIQAIFSSLTSLASDVGLEVVKFTPQAEVPREFFVEVPTYLELEGTFHHLVTFFDEVSHLSRIVNINDVNIELVTESNVSVRVRCSCKVISFRFLSEEEKVLQLQKQEEEKKKQKKRRRH